MTPSSARKPVKAWVFGLIAVAVIDVYLAFLFFGSACSAPALPQFMVLIVLPAIYLALMYLTLKSEPRT